MKLPHGPMPSNGHVVMLPRQFSKCVEGKGRPGGGGNTSVVAMHIRYCQDHAVKGKKHRRRVF